MDNFTVTERMVYSVMNTPCKTFDKGRAAMLGITLRTYQDAYKSLKAKLQKKSLDKANSK